MLTYIEKRIREGEGRRLTSAMFIIEPTAMLDHENPFCCGAIFGGGRATFGRWWWWSMMMEKKQEAARLLRCAALRCVVWFFWGRKRVSLAACRSFFLAISPLVFRRDTFQPSPDVQPPMFNTRCATPDFASADAFGN